MSLRTNVKFGEVNNLSDARYAAGTGASFVGFNFNPENPQYIDTEKFKEIAGWLDGPALVAQWDDQPIDYILEETTDLGIEIIQFNKIDANASKEAESFFIIQNISLDGCNSITDIIASVDSVQKYTRYFELSFGQQNLQDLFLSNKHNEILLTEFCRDYPVFLNFKFTPENILPILEKYNPFGINLSGGSEIKTGIKDFDSLNDIVDLLEI